MIMTRKQAIIGMLLASVAVKAQDTLHVAHQPGDSPLVTDDIRLQLARTDTAHAAGFSVEFADERPFMLEVKADGRVARFTAKQVMDALGAWFEPERGV